MVTALLLFGVASFVASRLIGRWLHQRAVDRMVDEIMAVVQRREGLQRVLQKHEAGREKARSN